MTITVEAVVPTTVVVNASDVNDDVVDASITQDPLVPPLRARITVIDVSVCAEYVREGLTVSVSQCAYKVTDTKLEYDEPPVPT